MADPQRVKTQRVKNTTNYTKGLERYMDMTKFMPLKNMSSARGNKSERQIKGLG